VSLSSDGNIALVGAYGDESEAGAAYIFASTSWSDCTETARMVASDISSGAGFGFSVSLSSDGSTALVGAYKDDDEGAAYIFTGSGSTWTQKEKLTASVGVDDNLFGRSVSLSSDGEIALIGACKGNSSSSDAAYIFTDSGSTWTQKKELTASDGEATDYFGYRVSLSSDGSTAIIGAYGANGESGAAYIFTGSESTWVQKAKLNASDGAASDYFGLSVSLSSDGKTALLGATGYNSRTGSAYIFTESGSTWRQKAKLTTSDGAASDYFGTFVSLSSDGSTALIGALRHDDNGTDTGAAYSYLIDY
jgi:hypothetical protein